MFYAVIPYNIDTFLYITKLYPTERVQVVEVGRYRGNTPKYIGERGYETKFLIDGKIVELKVKRRLAVNGFYRIDYLPNIKYVLKVW